MARAPDTIGKYKVISEIARGGMGAVYTAEHPTLDRTVTIKKLTLRGSAAVRERFRREASIMMDFRNEYIVDVFDHFREGPAYYIVQEYVDGASLSQLLERERYLPERVALLIFRDCCRALKYAHDRGVIHRDIKPGNILLSRKGDVKLVDFGIAHIDDDSEEALTREGTMLGTPSYMAPEQFQDTRSVDKRADIYSLGVMLYEMLTGKRPFSGSLTPETLKAIQHGKYRKPRKYNPAITRFTARVIRKAMSAKRARRYQDLGAILKRLDRRLGSRSVGEQKSQIAAFLNKTWSPPKRRSRLGGAVIPIVIVLLLLGAGAACYGFRSGFAYELLYPNRYGALTLTVRVARGSRPAQETSVSAELFRDDGKEIPRVTRARFAFYVDREQNTRETEVFVSRTVYLPAGQYRIKVMASGQLVWRGFYLESHQHQVGTAGRASGGDLVVSIGKETSLPLSVSIQARSAAGGKTITAGTSVELYANGSWVPFSGDIVSSLKSGRTYQFRLEHDGYYPADYALAVYPFQSELRLDADLVPYPGALDLSATTRDIRVRLDGSDTYRAWGRAPHPAQIPRIGQQPSELRLSPGSHTLAARSGSLTGEHTFTVQPLTRLDLKIVPDRKSGTILFESTGYADAPGLLE